MEFIKTSTLSKSQKQALCDLWNNEYPEQLTYQTLSGFEIFLKNLTEQSYIILVDHNQNIKGWYLDFKRENEKWFVLILDASFQGKGLGRKMLDLAKEKETALNGWVIDHGNDKKLNGESYKSPLNFYLKNGFELLSETRLELEKISAVKIKWEREKIILE
tara:strand:+ start:839 stop:1321 length:483 start_codon:yes stop_codon:yes gene_type:complete